MTPTSVNEPSENETASGASDTVHTRLRREPSQAAEAYRSRPGQADHWQQQNSLPRPPDELQIELRARSGEPRPDSGISEAELMSLLEDAHNADQWSEIAAPGAARRPSAAASPTPLSALTEHEAGTGQAQPTDGTSAPSSPPPDVEPAAAQKPERQLSQSEIDNLLARLLGG